MKNNDKQKNNIEICYGTLIVVKKKEKKKRQPWYLPKL